MRPRLLYGFQDARISMMFVSDERKKDAIEAKKLMVQEREERIAGGGSLSR